MLTVLKKSVAQGPEELTSPHVEADKRKNGIDLVHSFVYANSGTVCINLGDVGAIAYTHSRQPLLTPRHVFSSHFFSLISYFVDLFL